MKHYIKPIRVLSGTVATSILYTSCCPTFIDERDMIYLSTSNQASLNNSIAIPFSLNLKQEDYEYINFLQKLSKDIINNPTIAKEFSKDAEKYLKRYNYNKKINLDDSLLKLILALGDTDIIHAIRTNDVKKFLELCKQKKLVENIGFFKDEYYQEQIQSLYKKDDFKKYIDSLNSGQNTKSAPVLPPPPDCFVLAYFVAAIVASAAVAIAVAVVLLQAVEGPKSLSIPPSNQDSLAINAWILKNEVNNFQATFDNQLEEYIDDIIDFMKTNNPSYFENNSEAQIRELLKYNFTIKE